MGRKPVIIDLFNGAGGMSTGFEMAGFDVALGVEYIPRFAETFALNHPDSISLCMDIRELTSEQLVEHLDGKKIDVVTGGPPCQGFSGAGRRDTKDPRNSLFMDFVRVVDTVKPQYFVMENVPGILTMKNAKGEPVIEIIMAEFTKIGYHVQWKKLLAADYGVPQKRRRVIFIGCPLDEKGNPSKPIIYPKQTHSKDGGQQLTLTGESAMKKWVGAGSVLLSKDDAPKKSFHTQKMIDGFIRRKANNKANGKGFGWQIIRPDEPCYTISARYWKDGSDALVRYSENEVRMLTHGEAAAIQSFPPDYEFCGSNKDIFMQIGNAVPCLLAKAIGEMIRPYVSLTDDDFSELVEIWETEIRGKKTSEITMSTHGSLGHWVQEKFGQDLDSDKDADWRGLEIKTGRQKMTFGDWGPSKWMWTTNKGKKNENKGLHPDVIENQDQFVRMFGKPITTESVRYRREKDEDKRKLLLGRHSWSSTCPKIDQFNDAGSRLVVNPDNSIEAIYLYHKDQRGNKSELVNKKFHTGTVIIGRWESAKLDDHVTRKFGQKGWVKFVEKGGVYVQMQLFPPIKLSTFLEWVKKGLVFFDTGMYEGNPKPYCQFRASNTGISESAYKTFN